MKTVYFENIHCFTFETQKLPERIIVFSRSSLQLSKKVHSSYFVVNTMMIFEVVWKCWKTHFIIFSHVLKKNVQLMHWPKKCRKWEVNYNIAFTVYFLIEKNDDLLVWYDKIIVLRKIPVKSHWSPKIPILITKFYSYSF